MIIKKSARTHSMKGKVDCKLRCIYMGKMDNNNQETITAARNST